MPLPTHDVDAIRAAIARDADAVRRGDWDMVIHLFTPDAVRFPPNQPPVRGRTAMRAWLDTSPPIAAFSITADEIVGAGDVAFVRGAYAMTLDVTPPVSDSGHYMGLIRKQPDGAWLWSTDMAVSELPPS